jgi:hypothetical protein
MGIEELDGQLPVDAEDAYGHAVENLVAVFYEHHPASPLTIAGSGYQPTVRK